MQIERLDEGIEKISENKIVRTIYNRHETVEDAYSVVLQARVGSFVSASDTYLEKLELELHRWIAAIHEEQAKRMIEREKVNADV